MDRPFSILTNTKSSPVIIDLDDEDDSPVVNNYGYEEEQIANHYGLNATSVKMEILDNPAIQKGVECMLEGLSMDEETTKKEHQQGPIQIQIPVNEKPSEGPSTLVKGSIPEEDGFKPEHPIIVRSSSSSRRTQSTPMANFIKEESKMEFNDEETAGNPSIFDPQQPIEEEIGKKRKSTPDESSDDENVENTNVICDTIRTRTSPKTLYETVIGLTEEQKDAVYGLGLGSIVKMTMDGVATKLAYYVVDALNPTTMQLKVEGRVIPVTLQSIHELLGLPTGGVNLIEAADANFGKDLVDKWKIQFPKPNLVRPSEVKRLILKFENLDFMFKINFLVLFINMMADCNSSGTCNPNFLAKIENEEMLSNIDWCEYLYERLRTSKDKWRKDSHDCFYSGPITYLMLLYVDATVSKRVHVPSNQTAITVWNSALLRQRETFETNNGGFGLLPIKKSYLQQMQNAKGESIKTQSSSPTRLGEQDYMKNMIEKMRLLNQAKLEAERTLETAMSRFPGVHSFDRFQIELDMMFGKNRWTSMNINSKTPQDKGKGKSFEIVGSPPSLSKYPFNEGWNSPGFVAAAIETLDREVERSERRKAAKKLRLPDFSIDSPSFDLGISPEKKPDKPRMGGTNGLSPAGTGISFDITPNKKKVEVKAEADSKTPPRHSPATVRETRRNVGLGDHLRSPFVKRSVDFTVSEKEKRYHEWAMSAFGLRCDKVFDSNDGVWIIRAGIESLAANTKCYTSVVDAWSSLLNFEERYRNRDSPRRYFFNTTVLGNMHFKSRPTNIYKMYPYFQRNVSFSAKNNKDILRMKDLDLVFFPIIKHDHFYVMVFNFKNPGVTIIDSEEDVPRGMESMLRSYGYTTEILQILLVKHLGDNGHPLASTVKELKQERLIFDWQIRNNFDDSAVMAMRHMETYMGDNKSWKPGFDSNGPKLVSQIHDLRAKYVSKLLQSPCNSKRMDIAESVRKFFTIDQSIRFDMLEQARITRWERLNPYYSPN